MNMKSYKTVLGYGVAETEVKKSKFISQVFYVASENEAIEIINRVKKEHHKAVHNVFAYVIKSDVEIVRQSDDGEPSGTSGMPTLDILTKEGIKNTLIVTTRYFGGTLLGTGGLVSAYGSTAKLGVENAKVITKDVYQKVSIVCSYELHGKLQYAILDGQNSIEDTIYTEDVEILVYVPISNYNSCCKNIVEISGGKVLPKKIGRFFCAEIDGQFKIFEKL